MTKEQAIIDKIARLNSETWKDREDVRTEIGKLLSELLKILEHPTSDDCVSRAEVIKFVEFFNNPTFIEPIGTLRNMLKDLPPVTPTQTWIPVSERLPEEETDVLICNANKEIEISRGSYSTEIENAFIWYTSGWRFGEVLAWQPLPQAYEEKRGSEND